MTARTFTDEELQAAYRERRRHDWPPFEEAINDRFYHSLILIEAGKRARYREQRQQQAQQHPPQAHHQPRPAKPALVVPSTPPVFDHKRRAAGERDDD